MHDHSFILIIYRFLRYLYGVISPHINVKAVSNVNFVRTNGIMAFMDITSQAQHDTIFANSHLSRQMSGHFYMANSHRCQYPCSRTFICCRLQSTRSACVGDRISPFLFLDMFSNAWIILRGVGRDSKSSCVICLCQFHSKYVLYSRWYHFKITEQSIHFSFVSGILLNLNFQPFQPSFILETKKKLVITLNICMET